MDCEDDAKMQIPKYISKPCTAVVMMAKSSGPNLPFSPILLCGIRPKNPKASNLVQQSSSGPQLPPDLEYSVKQLLFPQTLKEFLIVELASDMCSPNKLMQHEFLESTYA